MPAADLTFKLNVTQVELGTVGDRDDSVQKIYWSYESLMANSTVYVESQWNDSTVLDSSGTSDDSYVSFNSLSANTVTSWLQADIDSREVSNSSLYTSYDNEIRTTLTTDMTLENSTLGTIIGHKVPWVNGAAD
jgi:hypothetical protein